MYGERKEKSVHLFICGDDKRTEVIAVVDNGEEYIFASVTDAVKILNIAPTTVKRHAENNTAVSTKLGVVVLKYESET